MFATIPRQNNGFFNKAWNVLKCYFWHEKKVVHLLFSLFLIVISIFFLISIPITDRPKDDFLWMTWVTKSRENTLLKVFYFLSILLIILRFSSFSNKTSDFLLFHFPIHRFRVTDAILLIILFPGNRRHFEEFLNTIQPNSVVKKIVLRSICYGDWNFFKILITIRKRKKSRWTTFFSCQKKHLRTFHALLKNPLFWRGTVPGKFPNPCFLYIFFNYLEECLWFVILIFFIKSFYKWFLRF